MSVAGSPFLWGFLVLLGSLSAVRGELCVKQNVTNGCSIPLQLPFFYKDRFLPACNRHDVCYSCGAGYGLTRDDCDKAFLFDMHVACTYAAVVASATNSTNNNTNIRAPRSVRFPPPASLSRGGYPRADPSTREGRGQRSFDLDRKTVRLSFLRELGEAGRRWAPDVGSSLSAGRRGGERGGNKIKALRRTGTARDERGGRLQASARDRLAPNTGLRTSAKTPKRGASLAFRHRAQQRRRRLRRQVNWCQMFAEKVYYPAVTTFGHLSFTPSMEVDPSCGEHWVPPCLPMATMPSG